MLAGEHRGEARRAFIGELKLGSIPGGWPGPVGNSTRGAGALSSQADRVRKGGETSRCLELYFLPFCGTAPSKRGTGRSPVRSD